MIATIFWMIALRSATSKIAGLLVEELVVLGVRVEGVGGAADLLGGQRLSRKLGSYGSPPQPQMKVSKSGAGLPFVFCVVRSVSLSDAHHLDVELDADLLRHLGDELRRLDVVGDSERT